MCKCIDVKVGSYGNQEVKALLPPHMLSYKLRQGGAPNICLDKCISTEVVKLWYLGITTTGCCCGHNVSSGYIGVIDEDIPRMKALGYEVHFNASRPGDEDSFTPKSI